MKKITSTVIVILLVSSFLGADIYTKSVERVKAFQLMGQNQPETLQMKDRWYGKNKYAEISREFSFIIDFDKEKMFLVIHERKMYIEIPTNLDGSKFFEFITLLSPKAAAAVKDIKITNAKANLRSERKKIANWDCTASEFEMVIVIPALNAMPKFKMKMWMTDDLPSDYEKFKDMGEFFMENLLGMLSMDEASQKELAKLESVGGFQIAADVTIEIFGSKIEIESQSLEVTEKPAPPGIYSVPKEYTKQDLESIKNQIKQIARSDTP
jgi:hypothetical protein